jgi:hypothetical protein
MFLAKGKHLESINCFEEMSINPIEADEIEECR